MKADTPLADFFPPLALHTLVLQHKGQAVPTMSLAESYVSSRILSHFNV